jgi:heme/copper-type cytochrome/quinol oxidase subunit 3
MSFLHIAIGVLIFCISYVMQKKKGARQKLVAYGAVEIEVCVQWYHFVSRFEVPRV